MKNHLLLALVLALCAVLVAVAGVPLQQQSEKSRIDPAQERVAVHLHEQADPHELARLHGYEVVGPIGSLQHHYLFQKLPKEAHSSDVLSSHIGSHAHVKWWQQQNARPLKRPLPHWNGEDERLASRP
jgi:hypothetical protein